MTTAPAIYLDHNATTPLAPEVLAAMLPFLQKGFANPSSPSGPGGRVKTAMGEARKAVAALLGADPAEIVFTSGATESNHTAILGALSAAPGKRHIITSIVEHPSILLMCRHLEGLGVPVTYLPVDRHGALDLDGLKAAMRPDTALVSLMWANNETGVLFPIAEAAAIVRAHGALFHTDATQAVGKLPIDLCEVPVDMLSFSGHKLHGPKGVGVLYVRKGYALPPLFHGHQERGRRGGTENVPAIIGLGVACRLAQTAMSHELMRMGALRDRLEEGILAFMPCARIHGQDVPRVPNTSNVGFATLDAEAILHRLEREGVIAATGAACAAGGNEPSHVLMAMGRTQEEALASIRFSLGRDTSEADIDRLLELLPSVLLDMVEPPGSKTKASACF
ncbi:MAG: cysteine desulfurase family protein [Pseudomonadota bacterium]